MREECLKCGMVRESSIHNIGSKNDEVRMAAHYFIPKPTFSCDMDVGDPCPIHSSRCEKCGFVKEDTDLHLFELHGDRSRLRGMIQYAKGAPSFDACKSILTDALDGVNGADNYDEIKGEREALRARVALLEKVAEAVEKLRMRLPRDCGSNHCTDPNCLDVRVLNAALDALGKEKP